MKLIAINGSPRKKGNTATLLGKVLEGAASCGAETELIHLYEHQYKGCISCFGCKRKGLDERKCLIKDELAPIYEKIREADALVLGSPIYFMNINSGMAAFLERLLYPNMIYSREIPTVFPKVMPTGLIYTMNMKKEQMEQFGLQNNLQSYQNYIKTVLKKEPEVLYSCNTVQFSGYDKYESSMFSEEEKLNYRKEQFPVDCNYAFEMGKKLIQ
ncbi:MAG: flavodoxin family protein [bacterium]|nr:flavodoxin family protein [bacterium]